MDIERKTSGKRRTMRPSGVGHPQVTGKGLGIRRTGARRSGGSGSGTGAGAAGAGGRAPRDSAARAGAGGALALDLTSGIVGTAIRRMNSHDRRRQFLTSVGSQYLDRLRTARSSFLEDHETAFPTLSELKVVGKQVSVLKQQRLRAKTPEPPAPPSESELAEETERLKTRALEVEAVLRKDFSTMDGLTATRRLLDDSMSFIDDLRALASESEHLAGAIFQELLARYTAAEAARRREEEEAKAKEAAAGGAGAGEGERPAAADSTAGFRNMSVDRERATGKVALEKLTDLLSIDRMVAAAHALCKLVRVKIEDDNDLGLAATVVEDSAQFFQDLVQLATWRHMGQLELLEELRRFD